MSAEGIGVFSLPPYVPCVGIGWVSCGLGLSDGFNIEIIAVITMMITSKVTTNISSFLFLFILGILISREHLHFY